MKTLMESLVIIKKNIEKYIKEYVKEFVKRRKILFFLFIFDDEDDYKNIFVSKVELAKLLYGEYLLESEEFYFYKKILLDTNDTFRDKKKLKSFFQGKSTRKTYQNWLNFLYCKDPLNFDHLLELLQAEIFTSEMIARYIKKYNNKPDIFIVKELYRYIENLEEDEKRNEYISREKKYTNIKLKKEIIKL